MITNEIAKANRRIMAQVDKEDDAKPIEKAKVFMLAEISEGIAMLVDIFSVVYNRQFRLNPEQNGGQRNGKQNRQDN